MTTLKSTIILAAIIIAAITKSNAQNCCGSSNKTCSKKTGNTASINDTINQTQQVYYACSMHPEIKSDKPGNCSKCGMALDKKTEKIKGNTKPETKIYYSCPMHSEIRQNEKGKCSKCGMKLEKQKEFYYNNSN